MPVKAALPDPRSEKLLHTLSPTLFRALGDPVRLSIVAILAANGRPLSVGDITARCSIDFSGVSRHLKVLRDAGVLSARKQGRSVHYALDALELGAALRSIADALDARSGQAGQD